MYWSINRKLVGSLIGLGLVVVLLTALFRAGPHVKAASCYSTLCVSFPLQPRVGRAAALHVVLRTADFPTPHLTLRVTGSLHWLPIYQGAGCDRINEGQDWAIRGWSKNNDWRYNHFQPNDLCRVTLKLVPNHPGRQPLTVRAYLRGTEEGGVDPSSEVRSLAWRWTGTVRASEATRR